MGRRRAIPVVLRDAMQRMDAAFSIVARHEPYLSPERFRARVLGKLVAMRAASDVAQNVGT